MISVAEVGDVAVAMRYATLSGGKRVRSALTLATAEMFQVEEANALRVASAIECAHAYSLIHDDLPCMDDDDLRRGLPAVHKVFGDAVAVLTGDALQSLAFSILADERTYHSAEIRCTLMARMAHAIGHQGMVGGQEIDIRLQKEFGDICDSDIVALHVMKTGALIEYSMTASAVMAGVADEDLSVLGQCARDAGLAYQIWDDVLDVIGDESEIGKQVGRDKFLGKNTFVSVYGIEEAGKRASSLIESVEEKLTKRFVNSEGLIALLKLFVKRSY
jgi:farnesyl diphosphate synthase